MDKKIILSKTDEILLEDILEYLLHDKEKEDLLTSFEVNETDFFDENGDLMVDRLPRTAHDHIYVKAFKLFSQLKEVQNV